MFIIKVLASTALLLASAPPRVPSVLASTALLLASAPPRVPLSVRRARPLSCASVLDDTPGWEQLSLSLDRAPVFTVANAEGQPLQYEIGGTPYAMFYADIEEAQVELEQARMQYPSLGCDLIPVGLGSAYKLSVDGKAHLLPSKTELQRAGAPANATAMGQPLPLFACMEMSLDSDDGPVLPLFLTWSDCRAAVTEAEALDSPDAALDIVGLSLPSVVERLGASADQAPSFIFMPDRRASKFIQDYLGPA